MHPLYVPAKWLLQRLCLPGHRAQVSVTHSSHSHAEHSINLRASVQAWRGCTSGAQHRRQPHAPSCREDPIESARWGAERSITAHTSSAVGRRLASSCLQALMMASTSSGHSSGTLHPKTSVLFVLKSISVRRRMHRTWVSTANLHSAGKAVSRVHGPLRCTSAAHTEQRHTGRLAEPSPVSLSPELLIYRGRCACILVQARCRGATSPAAAMTGQHSSQCTPRQAAVYTGACSSGVGT